MSAASYGADRFDPFHCPVMNRRSIFRSSLRDEKLVVNAVGVRDEFVLTFHFSLC